MWCRNVRNELSAFADGELPLAAARAVEEHLVQCERCAEEHKSLRKLVAVTRAIPQEDLPAGLQERILARLAYTSPEAQGAAAPAAQGVVRSYQRRLLPGPWAWPAFAGATAALALGFACSQAGLPRASESPAELQAATSQAAPRPEVKVAVEPDRKTEPRRDPLAAPRPHPTESAPVASHPADADQEPAATIASAPIRLVSRTEPAVRVEKSTAPAKAAPVSRENRLQPPSVLPVEKSGSEKLAGEKPVLDVRAEEPVAPAAPAVPPAKPAGTGEPGVSSPGPVVQPEVMATAPARDPATRMAGMMPDMAAPAEDEEGVRQLRKFFEDRNRAVPQPPPAIPNRDRRMRKSL